MAQDAPLLSLPLHLMTRVLQELDSIDHVKPAVLAHPFFLSALDDCPSLPSDIVRRQIADDEMFMLALAAFKSRSAKPTRKQTPALQFLLTYRDDPSTVADHYRYLSLAEASGMGQLHSTVEMLRVDFAHYAFEKLYQHVDAASDHATLKVLSSSETQRINRAFYRYQIYYNLFSESGSDDAVLCNLKTMFFDRHSPWVNEQLACVHDFLEAQLETAYDKAATQSVSGRKKSSDPRAMQDSFRRKQWHLSRGLSWLHELNIQTNKDRQYYLLCKEGDAVADPAVVINAASGHSVPVQAQSVLESACLEGVSGAAKISSTVAVPAASSVTDQVDDATVSVSATAKEHRDGATSTENDDGPYKARTDSKIIKKRDMFFILDYGSALRRVGYVMWDKTRVDEDVCQMSLRLARMDGVPTFLSKGKSMDVTASMERRFRPKETLQERRRRRWEAASGRAAARDTASVVASVVAMSTW